VSRFDARLNDYQLTRVSLHVPQRGAWFALCDLGATPKVSGRVTLLFGGLTLSGTVVPSFAGDFGTQRRVTVVGGGGGWGAETRPRGYHNDAGVKARLIAEDVAREVGEQIGTFEPENDRVGVDYVRGGERTASVILEDVIGDRLWWLDDAGVTHVGVRPAAPELTADDYQVIEFDPRARLALLAVSSPSVLRIGSTLTSSALPESQTVREYEVRADAAEMRVLAWCGGDRRSAGRLSELWRRVSARVVAAPLLGLYRYRVVRMAGDGRVDLQSVSHAAGVPDVATIPQWPGVPGIHATLSPGALVLVQFIEGDRTMPIVTHYTGQSGDGFVPVGIVIGGATGLPAARQTDTVEVPLPPGVFTGTIGGAPASGVITFPLMTTLGSITTGSPIVKVAP
jgi:hypothetical protein